jgi:hypothetical protein
MRHANASHSVTNDILTECFVETPFEVRLNDRNSSGGADMNFVRIMKFRTWIFSVCLITLCSSVGGAQIATPVDLTPNIQLNEQAVETNQSQPQSLKEFFTVDEQNLDLAGGTGQTVDYANKVDFKFSSFIPLFGPDQFIQAAKVFIVNLLRWTLHNEELQEPVERYIRKLHFGRWINDPADDTCMNTRARVLVRESLGTVSFRHGKQCVVDTGIWNDPYAGVQVSTAKEIQIDHMVPLKNAYVSGAWQWDYKTRCLYANYLGYKNHLVAAGGRENMSKGDRAPDKYLPTNQNYRCQYIKDWLAVKLIWKLTMTPSEVDGINQVAKSYNCDPSLFQFAKQDLDAQRDNIAANLDFCLNIKP